jgi:tetratricopeptide (TPR) repeat protein
VSSERIVNELDAEMGRYLRPAQSADLRQQPLDLAPEEQAFLNAISGRRTLREHLEGGLLGQARAHKLCYALLCAGIVDLAERPQAAFIDVSTAPALQVVPPPSPDGGRPQPLESRALAVGPDTASDDEPGDPLTDWSDEQNRTDPSVFVPLPDAGDALDMNSDIEAEAAADQGHDRDEAHRNGYGPRPLSGAAAAAIEPDIPTFDPEPELEDEGSLLARLEARKGRAASVEEWLATVVLCLRDASPAEILGSSPTASPEELARAYARLSRRYHPDRTAPETNDTRGTRTGHQRRRLLAEEIFQVISRAYESLTSDGTDRSATSNSRATTMAPGTAGALNAEVLRILSAERQFQLGETLIRDRQYEEAVEAFRQATDLNAQEGEFRAYLGWALFQCAPQDEGLVAEAIAHLHEGSNLAPRLDKPYLFLGYIYKALGRLREAGRAFEKAIEANPECDEAVRELKLLR